MAEKQLAYRASENEEFFADDDPLAELARIVGFEPRPAMPAAPAARRQEPAFDLEDELLREFERYDAPRLSPVDDIPLSVEDEPFAAEAAFSRPGNSNDPHFEHQKAEPEFSELRAEPEVQAEAYPAAEWSVEEEPEAHDWQQPARHEPVSYEPEPAQPELPRNEAVVEAPAYAPVTSSYSAPVREERDLADELEDSIADVPAAPKPVTARAPQWSAASIRLPLANFSTARPQEVAPVEVKAPEAKPAAPAFETAELPPIEPESPVVASFGFPAEQDRHELPAEEVHARQEPAQAEPADLEFDDTGFDLAAAARDGDVHSDAALTEAAYKEAAPSFDLDELLADVSRYPVPQRTAAPEMPPQPKAIVAPAAAIAQPVAAAPAPQPIAPAPVAAAPMARREEPAPVEMNDEDPFADHEFQFDLEDIELELADFDFTESKAPEPVAPPMPAVSAPQRPVAQTVAAPMPAPMAPVAEVRSSPVAMQAAPRPVPAPRPELAARPAAAPILHAPAPVAPVVMAPAVMAPVAAAPAIMAAAAAAPVAAAPAPRAMPDFGDADQALPFDPSEISETDDRIESFEGMHVPTLPPVEKEEPVAVPPEYDFDIDAEMANLFNAPQQDAAPEPAKSAVEAAAASWAKVTAAKAAEAPKPVDGLDEFERALEEDFRRSVREAAQPAENITRMTFEASNVIADRRRVRSMRGVAVAAVAVLALGGTAFGAYTWLSHSTAILASGEPRIITADKDPVKVVPENPGGKVVPNQDKAVYDRVAGDTTSAPKQKALVSSDEQPVDVVQKTLIPDASPDDADGDGDPNISTPVGETEDPRLLPNQGGNAQQTAAAPQADNQGSVPSVSPRKVRTMIVKPDGTLVARDDDAPAATAPAKAPTAQPKLAPASSASPVNQPAANQLASAAANDAPSAESTPIRVVKTTKLADAPAATVASASNPPVATQPVPVKPAPVQTAAAQPAPVQAPAASTPADTMAADMKPATSDIAPVPAARPAPAAKPPVVAHPAAAETQVAVASPATQPVKAAPAAAAGAGGYVMQIASLPSEADAKKSQANLSAKFASVIGGHPIEVKRFDIAGKGTYYRVRVVAGTKDQAADLCVRFRAAGGTCLISK